VVVGYRSATGYVNDGQLLAVNLCEKGERSRFWRGNVPNC
jgi:hypothetical protein